MFSEYSKKLQVNIRTFYNKTVLGSFSEDKDENEARKM